MPAELEEAVGFLELADADAVALVYRLAAASEEVLGPWALRARRYREKYRKGMTHADTLTDNKKFYTNYVFQVVESLKAQIGRVPPNISVEPLVDNDQVAAEIYGIMLRNSLERAQLKKYQKKVAHHGLITGASFFKVGFNADENNNELTAIPQELLYIDPMAVPFENARWIIHVIPDQDIQRLKRDYKVESIKLPKSSRDRSINYGAKDNRQGTVVDVYECWLRDYEAEHGWRIITVAGKTVLSDKPSPFDHGKAPFVPWYDGEDDGVDNPYDIGIGEVEEIESLQEKSEAFDARIYKNVRQQTTRKLIVNPASGINPALLDDLNDRVLMCNGDARAAVTWDTPPVLDQTVYMYRQTIDPDIQAISGAFDVAQGKRPSGVTAGLAIASLQEAASIRVRDRAETMAEAIRQVANLCLSNLLQYWSGKVIIRLVGQAYTVLDDYPEPLSAKTTTEQEKAKWKEENGIDLVLTDLSTSFDISVDSESALPSSRADRAQLYTDLFRLGALDRKALLDAWDIPNSAAILERLQGDVTGKTAGGGLDIPKALQGEIPPQGPGGPPTPPGAPVPEQGMPPGLTPEMMASMPPEMLQQLLGAMGAPTPPPPTGAPPEEVPEF